MNNTDELRKAFEEWMAIAFPHLETYGVEGFGGKVYRSPEAANLSIAFKAGAAHAAVEYDAVMHDLRELVRVAMTRPPEVLVDFIKMNWPKEYAEHTILPSKQESE